MKITFIPLAQVNDVWPKVEKILAPAIHASAGRNTLESVKAGLLEGATCLWVIYTKSGIKAAMVTGVIEYPAMRVLALHFIGGSDRHTWLDLLFPTMVSFAKRIEADKIELCGRYGWIKDAAKFGFTTPGQMYEMPVERVPE